MTTRERLSVEAARLFADRGYHGTSVADLAQALGIQKSSVYAHIDLKEDLLAEIAFAGARHFHSALDGLPSDGAPLQRLRLALLAHLGVVHSQLDVATVWLKEWRFLEGDRLTKFSRERRRYERRIEKLFATAVEAGELPAGLDRSHAVLLFFSIGNWAYTWMTPKTDIDAEAEAFWELMLSGFRGAASA
jgi:TetR/AcrR family transcriptional regulator, cholesterol catabolism regulator